MSKIASTVKKAVRLLRVKIESSKNFVTRFIPVKPVQMFSTGKTCKFLNTCQYIDKYEIGYTHQTWHPVHGLTGGVMGNGFQKLFQGLSDLHVM